MNAFLAAYAHRFPMTPIGGLFVGAVGLFVIAGAVVPKRRMQLLWIGFGAAVLALMLGGRLAVGLPTPTAFQVGALVAAILLEIAGFRVMMPRLRAHGERAALVGSLAIVGLHFFIMLPAFGPLIGGLGLACSANAVAAWRNSAYRINSAWLADGLFKFALGLVMMLTSPIL